MVATRFYPGAQENLSAFPSKPFGFNESAFALSQSLTTPFADPLAGFKDRNLRNGRIYTVKVFCRQFFVCFIFQKVIYYRLSCTSR